MTSDIASIQLIQPRHIYAPDWTEESIGHVYMPTSLLTVQARIMEAGINVEFVDENINVTHEFAECIGINLVGAPYVEPSIRIAERARRQRFKTKIFLGGQVVCGFTDQQFYRLFGEMSFNGNNTETLKRALRCSGPIPAPEDVSLVCAYEAITEPALRLYLEHEFCFYLSQGCKYSCSFCGADRSRPASVKYGPRATVREHYRQMSCIEEDLRYLIRRAKQFDQSHLQLYLSNLDLFQSPEELSKFQRVVFSVLKQNSGFKIRFRALSNVNSFLRCHQRSPELISSLVEVGLYRVGFGVDGATPEVWKAIRKPHGTYSPVEAIRVARECYGLTPEVLMVFGHVGVDDERSLALSENLGRRMSEEYGAVPRPHVAKSVVPGSDGWYAPENKDTVEFLISHPRAFQLLDFTALPSKLTHCEPDLRRLVAKYFMMLCETKRGLTLYTLPEEPNLRADELVHVRSFNMRRYDV